MILALVLIKGFDESPGRRVGSGVPLFDVASRSLVDAVGLGPAQAQEFPHFAHVRSHGTHQIVVRVGMPSRKSRQRTRLIRVGEPNRVSNRLYGRLVPDAQTHLLTSGGDG